MRAVIVATDYHPASVSLIERMPAVLLPLVDRPFLQHVVEYLIDRGITVFDFILCHKPEEIESLLGDGSRWGVTFSYHLARDPRRPYKKLSSIRFSETEPVLLGHADRLPQLDPLPLETEKVLCWQNEEEPAWTGWALLSSGRLDSRIGELDECGLGRLLLTLATEENLMGVVPEPLGVRTFDEMLESQRRVLGKSFDGLMIGGREVEDRVWLSRNVSLHPTARIIPPVFIGENSRIGHGAQIGPNAAIGRNCVLDARCTVTESAIFQGSFVGESLELSEVIVDKNRLVNVRFGVAVSVTDDFILSSMVERRLSRNIAGAFSRIAALLLLILASPVLLLTALWLRMTRKGPVLNRTEVISLPSGEDEIGWRVFKLWSFSKDGGDSSGIRALLLDFLPALVNVARGELRFVGVRPRTRQEIKDLPHDWRALYLKAKSGIITEAMVHYGSSPDEDELYSAEAFYSVAAGFGHDLRLLFGYLGRTLTDSLGTSRTRELQHSPRR